MEDEYFEFKHVYGGKEIIIRVNDGDAGIYTLRDAIERFLLGCTFQPGSVDKILKEDPFNSDEYLRVKHGVYP